MRTQSLGLTTDLMIRRIAGSEVTDRGDHIVVRTPSNPTFWWGNFIAVGADFANAERWLETFTQAHPTAAHVAIAIDAPEVDDELFAGYVALGLDTDVSTVLSAPQLVAPAPLDGVICRALDGDADWTQALGLMATNFPPEDESEELFLHRKAAEWRAQTEAGQGTWFGAFVDGQLRSSLGVLTDGGGVGRYQSVETHPEFRRRGLARQVIATAGESVIRDFAVDELVIVADPDYHAIDLYRSLGFVPTDRQIQVVRTPSAANST